MKKVLIGLFVIFMLVGCSGVSTNTVDTGKKIITAASEIAFVSVLQNNPQLKPDVVAGLNSVKLTLNGSLTYDDLITAVSKQFAGKYSVYAVILSGEFATDKPIIETALPMFEAYKAILTQKIDRFIFLANLVQQ